MKRAILGILVVALALMIAGTSFAQGRGMMGGPGMGPGMGPGKGGPGKGAPCDLTKIPGLNLSAEQSSQITAMQNSHWNEVKPLRDHMFAKRQELKQLWLQKSPDQAKIEAKQKELQDLRSQMQAKGTKFRLDLLKQLTPEQQEKVKAGSFGCPRWQGKGGHGHRMGKGMGPGMGM